MKKVNLVLLFVMVITMISCGEKKEQDSFGKQDVSTSSSKPEEVLTEDLLVGVGKEIFEGKGTCVACHQPTTKIIGPSIQEIAKIYSEKDGNIIVFLKGEGEPIVDPSQYEIMKANFAITKQMSDEELKSIEAYINSYL